VGLGIESAIMDELESKTTPNAKNEGMFAVTGEPERSFPSAAVGIAAVVVAVVVAVLVVLSRRNSPAPAPTTLQPAAAYATNLEVSGEQISEASSLSGGKSTYVDGHIANHGPATVTAVTVQVIFANDVGMAPEIETVPLSLIRTRQPYVDTEPMSAAPLAPGGEADFRLIFESVNANWNLHVPEIRAIQVTSR